MQTDRNNKAIVCICFQISTAYVSKLDYSVSVNEMFVDFKKIKPVIGLREEYCVLL
jgi:hypothetical protein